MKIVDEDLKKKHLKLISDCWESFDSGFLELSDWDQDFIESIEAQVNSGKVLTWKQSKVLIKIHSRIE